MHFYSHLRTFRGTDHTDIKEDINVRTKCISSNPLWVVNVRGPFLTEIDKLDLTDPLLVSTRLPTSLS